MCTYEGSNQIKIKDVTKAQVCSISDFASGNDDLQHFCVVSRSPGASTYSWVKKKNRNCP